VGVEPPVAVPVVADLNAPIIGEQVPALPGFLERPVAHRPLSPLESSITRRCAGRPTMPETSRTTFRNLPLKGEVPRSEGTRRDSLYDWIRSLLGLLGCPKALRDPGSRLNPTAPAASVSIAR